MSKYFEGTVEYSVYRNDSFSHKEIHYFKDKYYRKDTLEPYSHDINIWQLDEMFIIYPEEKRIVVNGDFFIVDEDLLNLKSTNVEETILDYTCKKKSILVELPPPEEQPKISIFVSEENLLHPSLKDKDVSFYSQFLPLKIYDEYYIHEEKERTIKIATEVIKKMLPKKFFTLEKYESLNYRKFSFEEYREILQLDAKKHEQDFEEEQKRWEKGKEEREKQSKILEEKTKQFLTIEFRRKLTKEEEDHPIEAFINYNKQLSSDELTNVTNRFLDFVSNSP